LPDARRAVIGKFDSSGSNARCNTGAVVRGTDFSPSKSRTTKTLMPATDARRSSLQLRSPRAARHWAGVMAGYIAILRRDRHSRLDRLRPLGLVPPQ